ncbi:Zn-ribbon domain-containing OB-fold protein [Oceanicoccus sp. KOV_DT_Chl]|uniref:Zn-ribbon domain-containing OB-fold protein n=1 Tax=Oceanicoccus sp. KOV_DT_Chl TaxID=1904639 RepID=UPI000C7C26A5|nr:OB-fold domain-containing protein [Oceanicoccus sp. KOV_DT_Chl]
MSDKPQLAAIEGWHTMDVDQPHLIGSCCTECGTYYFPKQSNFCKNPHCDSTAFDEVQLSRTGKVWSYTNACYKPPEPFVAAEPFEPYTIAAVELAKEQMIVLGQVITGVSVDQLKVGDDMELVLEVLHDSEDGEKLTWKWKPMASASA